MDHSFVPTAERSPILGDGDLSSHAFLVHSRTSLAQGLPPQHDNSFTARQKRRRTSPQDHAILEAAYLRNSKPDKNERADVVSRVSLGEKEVQIWFQNRRQNDRRRSRPLLPHELVPHFRNDVPKEVLLHSSGFLEASTPGLQPYIAQHFEQRPASAQSFHSHVSIQDLLNPASSVEEQVDTSFEQTSEDGTSHKTPPSSFEVAPAIHTPEIQTNDVDCEGKDISGSGKKRTLEGVAEPEADKRPRASMTRPDSSERPTIIRLSMTVDGAVKVKTRVEDTPSPPKVRDTSSKLPAMASMRLQRSKSAMEGGQLSDSPVSTSSTPRILGRGFGRSRDARTWQFYCDGDARDALSTHAENETSGSAVGAISLIRSQSQNARKQILSPQIGKGNPTVTCKPQVASKPQFSRAKSSLGRLQGANIDLNPKLPEGSNIVSGYARSPSGDSDKENWAPGTRISTHPLRRTEPTALRYGILENAENVGGNNHLTSAPEARQTHERQSAMLEQENRDSWETVSTRKDKGKGEDLDCVQGLLSLSQGAWK